MAGELANIHNRVAQLVRDIEHLDATLQIVAPDMVPEAIPPRLFQPCEDWSERGQMSRLVLGILRNAREPLASRDIASQLILERGMAMDMKLLRLMTKRVSCALRDKREKGIVRSIEGIGVEVRARDVGMRPDFQK